MPGFFLGWGVREEDRENAHEENRLAAVRATEENRVYFSRGKGPGVILALIGEFVFTIGLNWSRGG